MPQIVRACLIQYDIITNSPRENLEKITRLIKKTVEVKSPDIILLPELFTTGFGDVSKINDNSEDFNNSDILSAIKELSGKNSTIICGSVAEKESEKIYNTAFVFENGKFLEKYRKINLFSVMKEDTVFTPGSDLHVIKTSVANLGLQICYDLRFPEICRELAAKGAEIIITPSNFPDPREDIWQILLQARAVENQLFLTGANRTGSDGTYTYFGHSTVAQPDGKLLTPLVRDESILTAKIDLDLINDNRDMMPAFRDYLAKN